MGPTLCVHVRFCTRASVCVFCVLGVYKSQKETDSSGGRTSCELSPPRISTFRWCARVLFV